MTPVDLIPAIDEAAADAAAENNAGQAWACPQEMEEARPGLFPHGLINKTSEGYRVWHDARATWFWL